MQLLYTVVFFRHSAPAEAEAGSAEDCSTLGAGEGRKLLGPKKVNLAHSLFYVTQIHNGAIRGRVCKCHFHRGSRPGTEGKYVVIVRPSALLHPCRYLFSVACSADKALAITS